MKTAPRPLGVLVCCLSLITVAGCASSNTPTFQMPWQQADDDSTEFLSPAKRTESLRKLAGKARWSGAEKKRQIVAELSAAIQNEEDPLIRTEIVYALSNYPIPETDTVLRAALQDPNEDVRVAACEAWGKRGTPEAAAMLGGALGGDLSKDVRLAAARALGETKDRTAVAALGAALDDRDPAMQYRAVLSLKKITGENFGNDVDRWRQYVQSGSAPAVDSPSLADRALGVFH